MPSFTAILLLLTVRLNSASAGPIKMNGKQIVRALHDNVLLPCTIITNKPISQFMWKLMRGQQELNIFTADFRNGKHQHFDEKFDGRITYVGQDHKNASIYFKNLTLQDEGIYRCIFTLFPDGPFEEEIQLTLTDMSSVIVRPQKTELGSLYLVCSADANPPAIKFIWTKDNGPIPEGVIIENDRVKLIKLTPDLYGLYLCEASNAVGAASGSLYLFTGDHQPRKYIILLIVIILVLVFVIGILSYCYHRKMQTNKETSPEVMLREPLQHQQRESVEVDEVQVDENEADPPAN
ncbi:nectin-3-like isoform X4 [Mustelus asterias]